MDTRSARRAAEKAARDLVATRAAVIGDLGVSSAEHAQCAADETTAQQRGEELVRAARAQADQLVAASREQTAAAASRYAETHARAVAAGWAAGDLAALGFPSPTPTGRGRRSTSSASSSTEPVADPRPNSAPSAGHTQTPELVA